MTVVNDPDTLVGNYLARLELAARDLPAQRRTELLDEVRAHIAEARMAGADDGASVRTMLDRLGTPEEIVAAAQDSFIGPDGAIARGLVVKREPRLRGRDIAALLLLPFGGFVLVVGWLVGVVLLWSSDRWRTSEKWLGTLVLPFGYLGLFVMVSMSGQACTSGNTDTGAGDTMAAVSETCSGFGFPTWIGIPLLVVQIVAPAAIAAILTHRAAPSRG